MADSILQVKHLSLDFSQGFNALSDINFTAMRGDFISVVGANGSGKTTLIKTILGIYKNYTGEILINGEDHRQKRSSIAYVPQVKTLDFTFPAKALELVASGMLGYWPLIIGKDLRKQSLGMLEKMNSQHLAKRQLSELSGGELQRVYLARALIKSPDLLLLDEPVTGIDFICESDINANINEYNKSRGTTIIMVTHDISSAFEHTQKALILNKHQVYFGDVEHAFTDEHLQQAFSHGMHSHSIKFGLKSK